MMLLIPLLFLWGAVAVKAEPSEINANHRSFADALTAALYQKENECTSSLGVSMAFSLIYPSSTGTSQSQIRSVMGYPEGETHLQLVWNETADRLDTAYDGLCASGEETAENCNVYRPVLEIANSVWIDDNFTLSEVYSSIVDEYLQEIDFDADTAGGIVNEWVNASTKGLIDSIVEEGRLYPPYILIAVNSIYLKGSWLFQFEDANTNKDIFYTDVTRAKQVSSEAQFMHQVEEFPYSHDAVPGYQIVKLPLAGGNLSMILVLPLMQNAEMVSSTELIAVLPQLSNTRLALAIPKFQFETTYEDSLKNSLKSIGLEAPFMGELCVREGSCDAFIDFVIQKTFIDVNEMGVEAAAVTAIGVVESAPAEEPEPILVQADHPLQFFIYDDSEELMIFEGRVGKPVVADDAPEPQLEKQHSDNDFWSSIFFVNPEVVPEMNTSGASIYRTLATVLAVLALSCGL